MVGWRTDLEGGGEVVFGGLVPPLCYSIKDGGA